MATYADKLYRLLGIDRFASQMQIIQAFKNRKFLIESQIARGALAPENKNLLNAVRPGFELTNTQQVKEYATQGLDAALQVALFNSWSQTNQAQGINYTLSNNGLTFTFPNEQAYINFNNYYNSVIKDNNLTAPQNIQRAPITPTPRPPYSTT